MAVQTVERDQGRDEVLLVVSQAAGVKSQSQNGIVVKVWYSNESGLL